SFTPQPSLTPTPDGQQLQLGWQAIEARDPTSASAIAQTIINQDPQAAQAYSLLAAALVLQDQPEEAIINLEHAQALGSEDLETLPWLGRAYLQQIHNSWDPDLIIQRIQDLKTLLFQLEDLDPSHEFVTQNLKYFRMYPSNVADLHNLNMDYTETFFAAMTAIDNEKFETAIENLELVVEQSPDFLMAKALLATSYYIVDDFTRSIELLLEITQVKDNDADIWIILGDDYASIHLPAHAKEAFVQALILDPENTLAIDGLYEITDIYHDWQRQPDEDFGFSFKVPGFTVFYPDVQANDNQYEIGSIAFSPTGNTIASFTWTTPPSGSEIAVNDLEEASQTLMEMFLDDPPDRDPLDMQLPQGFYPYNSIEMYYRFYKSLNPEDGLSYINALYVWRCGDRLFFFHAETQTDDLQISYLVLNPILESVQCEPSH
ncbi:MAG: hypothetical protein PVG63_03905, partial [Anaerolineales bacterium]